AASRPRVGTGLPGRHPHRRRPRRAAAAQARPARADPHDPGSGLQGSRAVRLWRGASLRARLFTAIGLAVVLSIGLTLALGLVLTRRAVESAALDDVARQANLLAGQERASVAPLFHLKELRPFLQRQHERVLSPAPLRSALPAFMPESARNDL